MLTVGRPQKRKGLDTLILALPSIRDRHPVVLYAILGDREVRSALGALAESEGILPNVNFFGEVSDSTGTP